MDDETKMPNTLSPVAPKTKTRHDIFMPKIHSRTIGFTLGGGSGEAVHGFGSLSDSTSFFHGGGLGYYASIVILPCHTNHEL
jgi:hypothetical protein